MRLIQSNFSRYILAPIGGLDLGRGIIPDSPIGLVHGTSTNQVNYVLDEGVPDPLASLNKFLMHLIVHILDCVPLPLMVVFKAIQSYSISTRHVVFFPLIFLMFECYL